ncbi:MAG: ABC transporter ATP-binding protein [Ignavibacteriota bacterium]
MLDRLDLRIEQGERIALIGENGEGKTTIVKLLTRLYDPHRGKNSSRWSRPPRLQHGRPAKQVGVIFQDFMRYEMTARQNIAVGRITAAEDAAIRGAASKSLADHVIERLPKQYDQLLGLRFEGGVDLSGGEWQKVALARAYMRDAQVVILDEPTASLDARSEYEVFQRFAELTAGKTALLISHRFSTVRMADRIVVLEKRQNRRTGQPREIALPGRAILRHV